MNDRLLLRPSEAARLLGIGRSTIYELIAAGDIPYVRIGNSLRVPLSALRAWIDQQLSDNGFDGLDRKAA